MQAPDDWFLKGGLSAPALADALVGTGFTEARRIGKLLLLDTDGRATLGLRFGMTGRLLVDGSAGVDRLIYSSARAEPVWDRVRVVFADGGDLVVRDPRRLGGVSLDPDESRLGIDATAVSPAGLRRILVGSTAPSRPASWTRPASPAWATSSPTRCCSGPGSTRPARQDHCWRPRSGVSTATCARPSRR